MKHFHPIIFGTIFFVLLFMYVFSYFVDLQSLKVDLFLLFSNL